MSTAIATRPTNGVLTILSETEGVDLVKATMLQLKALRTFVAEELKRDLDYGVIPGTKKPSLLKPGAHKIFAFYDVFPDPDVEPDFIELGEGHLEVRCKTRLISRITDKVVGGGRGSCTTMESRFRFRKAARVCPECGKEAIIKGKEDFGGGWLCWKKHKTVAGCGAKFEDGDPAIEDQAEGQVDNENIWDQRNSVLKQGEKRSDVDAALRLGCVSELFTQDMESTFDVSVRPAPEPEAEPASEPPPKANGKAASSPRTKTSSPPPEANDRPRESQRGAPDRAIDTGPLDEFIDKLINGHNDGWLGIQDMAGVPKEQLKPLFSRQDVIMGVASQAAEQKRLKWEMITVNGEIMQDLCHTALAILFRDKEERVRVVIEDWCSAFHTAASKAMSAQAIAEAAQGESEADSEASDDIDL